MYVLGGLAGASIIAGIVVFVMMDVEEEQTSKSTFRFGRDIVASPMLLRGGGVTTQMSLITSANRSLNNNGEMTCREN